MNFIEKYNHKKNVRYPFFKETLRLSMERKVKVIVETGTSRGKSKFLFFTKFNWKDGMSTLMFAEFANLIDGELNTCDISAKNISNARNFTKKFHQNVNFSIQDSVVFLKNFNKQIDLLYLDSFDGHNVELASKHQLKESEAVIDKLSKNSLVILDDKGAKTIYSTSFFINNGFKILIESKRQVLLSKSL